MKWHDWIREVKRIAIEKYEFCRATAETHFGIDNMWVYFKEGMTPEEALEAERASDEQGEKSTTKITGLAFELATKFMGAFPTYHDDARYNKHRDMLAQIVSHELDKIFCPDFETAVRMVGAHIHQRGKFYIEIAVDERTKEVASTFEPTLPKPLKQIAQIIRSRLEKLADDVTFTDGEILREEAQCIEKVILEFAPTGGNCNCNDEKRGRCPVHGDADA